jgi:CARDB.
MRKILTLLLVLAGLYGFGQPFNNEWIRHEQTYYKIKIARAGLYRIPKNLLDAAGIGNAPVQNLELWRNGERVPFYTPNPNGPLPSNGYIEFWGEANDGKPDKALYRDPAYQHTDLRSLQTDTAVYFLSVNSNQSGFKVVQVTNNVQGNTLPEEPYYMASLSRLFNRSDSLPNMGLAAVVGTYVYSSSYDKGEFFSTRDITPGSLFTTTLSSLNVYSGGPGSTIKFGAAGNALNKRSVKLRVNNTDLFQQEMDFFNDLVTSVPVSTSLIASGSAKLDFINVSDVTTDRYVVSFVELIYPRNFNFLNARNFKFTLPARSSGYFLRISNFNHNNINPVLYDLANGERFVGDLSVAGYVQFALPGTANERDLVLVSEDAANINTVTALTPRVFKYYKDEANQGDYLIISNPLLYTGSSGNNPIMDYKNYRESAAGGGHKVVLAEIDELVDQFAFGIAKHPLSVRNFIRYARTYFAQQPRFVFLIGRGMNYAEYQRANRRPASYPLREQLNLVPTFGNPASDNLLSAEDLSVPVAKTPIGRLSVVSGKEVEDYLEKLKEYEQVQKTAPNTLEGRAWMKNIVHVTGSSDKFLGTVLCNYMNVYKQIIEDTLFGGKVTSFCKESTNPVEQLSSERLTQLFEEGINFLTYFGHSSSTTLEFNIDNPQAYENQGKYPVFFVNGCNAGNFFTYYPNRMVANETLSEKFVLAKQRGTIGFVASTHYGIVNYLNLFLTNLYKVIGRHDIHKPLGEIQRDAMQQMYMAAGSLDFYARMHAEQIALNGDPAIYISSQTQPDYVIEDQSLQINPVFVSLAENSFRLKMKVVNLGLAVRDSVTLEVKQQYPDGSTSVVYSDKIPGIRYADSLTLEIPIQATRDKGLNKITVTIDPENLVQEVAEDNNSATKELYIYEDEARPAYPYNFAIIDDPKQKLYASTANPMSTLKNYILEVDTTEAFNSSLKITKSTSSTGGVLEFDTDITYKDSTIYYWRVAPVPESGGEFHWSNFSFTYIPNTNGYNQSHFYQHVKSRHDRLYYDSASRTLKYGERVNNVFVRNCIYQEQVCALESDFTVTINDVNDIASACVGHSVLFNILDSVTLKPWRNVDANGNNLYLWGSGQANCKPNRYYNFEFSYMNAASRKKIMDFMDSIPQGCIVVVRSIDQDPVQGISSTWMSDTTLYGSNNSLYHKLLGAGFVEIDSINKPRAWILVYKKGAGSNFIPQYAFGQSYSSRINVSVDVKTPDTLGYITSPVFGPAKNWKEVQWDGYSLENPSPDNPTIDIIGINKNNTETLLHRLDRDIKQFDISHVDPQEFPYLKLKMRNVDSVRLTPFQLKYWRVLYDEKVPEGAIAPNLYFLSKDTLELGEPLKLGIAFKNISKANFDSILVKINVIDKDNVTHQLLLSKYKPLVIGDTLKMYFEIDTQNFPGINTLNVYFNPDNDQPEHYTFNNFLFRNFYVRPDNISPLLDVTFDGVHILNRDIVSAKPHIQIKLKDESEHLLLNDTSVSSVEVRYPDGTLRTFHFDGDTLRFIPATSAGDNTATIDFTPAFTQQINPEGDEYELIVRGQDRSRNKAGKMEYRIAFRVISKPMISNLLNYPNPFSTSTAFVFTLTGSEIPQNLRIQILTVTGKIVREITMNELGPIRIGRNITEFKWDGTDQYGQKLANGVYLYRVITSMNGKPMDKYKAENDNTDKYFNNGYGKMYLMR